MVQILETMFVGLGNRKGGSFGLQVEIDEASRAWLQNRLVERVHRAELSKLHPVVMHRVFARASCLRHGAESVESLLHGINVLLFTQCKVLFVLPDFFEHLRRSFGD